MNVYATTDTHFSHERLKTMGNGRPDDYEKLILADIRKHTGDILVHCGDFCIGNDAKNVERYMEAAKGFKFKWLIRGNHDGKSYNWYMQRGFSMVVEVAQIRMYGKELLFSHMPIKQSDYQPSNYHKPARNFHGHLHGNANRHAAKEIYNPEWHYDLAPDLHDYKLVNIEKIVQS